MHSFNLISGYPRLPRTLLENLSWCGFVHPCSLLKSPQREYNYNSTVVCGFGLQERWVRWETNFSDHWKFPLDVFTLPIFSTFYWKIHEFLLCNITGKPIFYWNDQNFIQWTDGGCEGVGKEQVWTSLKEDWIKLCRVKYKLNITLHANKK